MKRLRKLQLVLLIAVILVIGLAGCKNLPAPPQDIEVTPRPTNTVIAPTMVPDSSEEISEMQLYVDSQYGFQIAYPLDWTYKSTDMNGPGMPDDWPVESATLFFPASIADDMNREGPPDPNAPSVVAPFSIEVFVGPVEQFRRAYPDPAIEETMQVNGIEVTIEKDNYDDYNSIRYIFSHPVDETIKVILVDVLSGFSDRVKANPEYSEIIQNVVTTFEFTGEPTLVPDLLEYQTVEIPEAGLTFDVPASWERVEPEWIWKPTGNQGQQVGVKWIDLQPPQEAEAALLPQPSQILNAEETNISWATGRTFTLEVYDTASQEGNTKAAVKSVEKHLILVVDVDGGRRAYDFFSAGSNLDQLDAITPVYTHLLNSVILDGVQQVNPLDAIRMTVAEKLNEDPNSIDLVLQATEFPDACLGMPAEDEVCAQVITPGFGGQVKVGDKVYEIRANEDGTRILICDESQCLD